VSYGDYTQRLEQLRAEIATREGELDALRAQLAELERLQLYADIITQWTTAYPERDHLPTATIRDLLRSLDDRPYAGWQGRRGELALSGGVGWEPTKIRDPDRGHVRGYRRRDIEGALKDRDCG
jgi:hypothetical protein